MKFEISVCFEIRDIGLLVVLKSTEIWNKLYDQNRVKSSGKSKTFEAFESVLSTSPHKVDLA